MRLSTNMMFELGVNAMLRQQSALSNTQLQVASGKKNLNPSDDPIAASAVLQVSQSLAVTEQHTRNADRAEARLTLEEGVLGSVTDVIQRVRVLALQANNDSQTNDTRPMIAAELRQRLEELVSLANTRDSAGEYIFSGTSTSTTPIARGAGGVFVYSGDGSQRFLQISPDRTIADGNTAVETFLAIREGNGVFATDANTANTGTGIIDSGSVTSIFVPDTYTITFTGPNTYDVVGAATGPQIVGGTYQAGSSISFGGAQVSIEGVPQTGDSFTLATSQNKDIFSMVDDLINTLEAGVSNDADSAIFHNQVANIIGDLDQADNNILKIRADVGGRLNAIDSQRDINEGVKLQNEIILSSLQDLDYAEAVSRLNIQLTGLQAAQQSFVKIQSLSLFNFL